MGSKIAPVTIGEESTRVDLTIEQGATWKVRWVISGIPSSGLGWSTSETITSAAMQIRTGYGGSVITGCDFTSTGGGAALVINSTNYSQGQLTITLTLSYSATSALVAPTAAALAGNSSVANGNTKVKFGVYDLEVLTNSGKWRAAHGDVYFSYEVTA